MCKCPRGSGLLMTAVAFSCLVLLFAAQAGASVILNYAGQNFTTVTLTGPGTPPDLYTTSDHVSGSIELAAPLGANLSLSPVTPASFSLIDGVNTITDGNASSSVFFFSTDGAGHIVEWHVIVQTKVIDVTVHESFIQTSHGSATSNLDFVFERLCTLDLSLLSCHPGINLYTQTATSSPPGDWSQVPVPGTLFLLGVGLAGFAVSRPKRPS